MCNRLLTTVFGIVVTLTVLSTLSAQTNQPQETRVGTPDLSGVWNLRRSPTQRYLGYAFAKDEPPMTPWAEQRFLNNKPSFGPRAASDSNDPDYDCYPAGVPRVYLHPTPFEIFNVPERVIMFFEHDNIVRQIWLNREHPKELDPSEVQWFGDSIGKWEGDTLVVDTIGFNDKTWLDRAGTPHSDALHLVERIRRLNHSTLQIDLSFEDPKAYTKTWGSRLLFQLKPGWHIFEHVCRDYPKPTQ